MDPSYLDKQECPNCNVEMIKLNFFHMGKFREICNSCVRNPMKYRKRKTCCNCKEVKDLDQYYDDHFYGKRALCKTCYNLRSGLYRDIYKSMEKKPPDSKICSKCKNERTKDDFHKNSYTKTGLYSSCKSCVSEDYKIKYVCKKIVIKTSPGCKICSKCKIEIPINMFHKSKPNKDGLYSSCKLCKHKVYKNRKLLKNKMIN